MTASSATPTEPRSSARQRIRQGVRSLSVGLAAALLAGAGAPAARAALGPGTTQVYPARVRTVCHLPRSGNPQRVLGYDTGFSFVYKGTAYWSFGDSLGDRTSGVYEPDEDGDGVADDPFRTGTLGRTTDLKFDKCVDVALASSNGTNVLTIPAAPGDGLRWPGRPVEANGGLYFFYNLFRAEGSGTALGKITNPTSRDLGLARVPGWIWGPGERVYNGPLKVGGRIYVFSRVGNQLRMARVAEAQIEDPGSYEYFDGAGWVGDPDAAAPFFGDVLSAPTVAYFPAIDRYMIVYTCGFGAVVCSRTAQRAGASEDALWAEGWNAPTAIFASGSAGHAFWHTGYADPSHPARIYLSTANPPQSQNYWVTLYEIDLSDAPAPATVVSTNQDSDFSQTQGTNGWSYASYVRSQPGTTLTELSTLVPIGPPPPPNEPRTPPYPVWVGDEQADGLTVPGIDRAPGVFARGIFPSPTRAGAKVWTVPFTGTVEVSGEAWVERTCGDGATGEVLLLRGSDVVRRLWRKNLPQKWARSRGRRTFQVKGVPVLAGDRLVFGVGNRGPRTAQCDLTYFLTSIVLTGGAS